jgi:hypothetical protein
MNAVEGMTREVVTTTPESLIGEVLGDNLRDWFDPRFRW